MRYVIFTLLLLASLEAFSQDKNIRLGFQFSGENISGDGFLATRESALNTNIARDEFNFSTGLTANFLTNSSFSFQTGLLYSKKDITTYEYCVSCFAYYGQVNQRALFLSYVPIPKEINQRFLSIPFLVRFEDREAKLAPIFEAGIYNNFLLSDNDFEETKSAFMEAAAGLGLSYRLNKQMRVEFKYSYRQSITSIFESPVQSWSNDDSDPNKLKTQSFQLGLNYLLK